MARQKTVSKADLVEAVASSTGMTKKDVRTVMDDMIDKIAMHMGDEQKVQLTGFGTFEVRTRRERSGVRPGTTEKINIPASRYPAFKPGKALKDKIK